MNARASSVGRMPERTSQVRRWFMRTVILSSVLAVAVWFAPHLVSRPFMHGVVLRLISPTSARHLAVESLSLSWHRPIEARGLRYRTRDCELVATSASCERSLFDLLRDRTDLGLIELKSPQWTLKTSAVGASGRRGSSARPRDARGKGDAITWPRIYGELHVSDGTILIADSASDAEPVSIARGVQFVFRMPRGSDRSTFRLIARTGDPHATAHLSAQGAVRTPLSASLLSLLEAQIEAVGLDLNTAHQLFCNLNPAVRSGAVIPRYSWGGRASGNAEFRRNDDGTLQARTQFEAHDFSLSEHAGERRIFEPAVSVSAVASVRNEILTVSSFRLNSHAITLDADGTISDWSGRADADLSGTVRCDWTALQSRLGSRWPDSVAASGSQRRPWRVQGPLRGTAGLSVAGARAEVATSMDAVRLYDFDLGPIDLAAHWAERLLQFDPVNLAVQNGRVALHPQISFEHRLPVLRMPAGRVVHKLELTPELCDGILRHLDPLFTVSGKWSGRLSFDVDELEIPLIEEGMKHGRIVGRLWLEDVEFVPDESLAEVFAIAGVSQASVRTSQAIQVRLEDGRLYHTGLTLPIDGSDEHVTIDGWVDLDHRLSLRISLPITERMLGKDKKLFRLLKGQRIEVPVTGTVDDPQVSEETIVRNVQRLVQIALRDSLSSDDPLRGLLRRALK